MKDKIKDKLSKCKQWMKDHKGVVIATAVGIGGAVLTVTKIKNRRKNTTLIDYSEAYDDGTDYQETVLIDNDENVNE